MSNKLSDNSIMADNMAYNVSDNLNVADNVSNNVSDKLNMTDNVSVESSLSDKKYRSALLFLLAKNGEVSATEAADIIGRTAKTARRVLIQLVNEGIVIKTGANRNRKYRLKR